MSRRSKSKIYLKRIISDINEISKDYDPKIHIWYDESDIKKIKALVIGPHDTPYEDGFFFFSIEIPETYPFSHPSAKFETINGNIRFNPNLYEAGKVCLSIIGTWSGPKWSSIQTLKSLLLSIQSLMDENPINNEPSYENVKPTESKAIEYNEYVRFNTYEFAIYEMLVRKNHFPYFNEIIEQYFIDNFDRLIQKLESYTKFDGKTMKTFIWNHKVEINYTELIEKYKKLYESLKDKDFSNNDKNSVHTGFTKNELNQDI